MWNVGVWGCGSLQCDHSEISQASLQQESLHMASQRGFATAHSPASSSMASLRDSQGLILGTWYNEDKVTLSS